MTTATTETTQLVSAYYDSWQKGIETFDRDRLGKILAEDFDFEGSIAGKRRGPSAGFVAGLQRFVEVMKPPIKILHRLESGDQAAVLYEAELPGGTTRFAEFFRIENGRIASLHLVYDAAQYRDLGGR
jgi:ketosteroid isomerase-like protein